MVPVFPELSVNINHKRWICVVDPALALSPFGLQLVKRLGAVMQVWVAREHLHILDNTPAYKRWPEKLAADLLLDSTSLDWPNQQAVLRGLMEWDRMRMDTDPGKMKIHWIGDGIGESILPEDFDPAHVWRFEALSSSLDNRLKHKEPLVAAFRDALALSAALPSAIILTQMNKTDGADMLQTNAAREAMPLICQSISQWDLPLKQVDTDDDWLKVERDFFQSLLVWAGLAKLHWSGLKLAVLHVLAPSAAMADKDFEQGVCVYDNELMEAEETGLIPIETDYWQDAKGYWYPL